MARLSFTEPLPVPGLPDRYVTETVYEDGIISEVLGSGLQLIENDASQVATRPLHSLAGQQNLVDCAQSIFGHHQNRQSQFRGERLNVPIFGKRRSPSSRSFDHQRPFPAAEIGQVLQLDRNSFLSCRQHRCDRGAQLVAHNRLRLGQLPRLAQSLRIPRPQHPLDFHAPRLDRLQGMYIRHLCAQVADQVSRHPGLADFRIGSGNENAA